MLPVHHQRHSCVLEHMARNTTQDQLTEARVGIGTHYEQVTGKFIGRRQQPCANHVVYSFKRRSIGRETVRGEVLLEVRRKRSAPLIIFRPEDAYRLRALQPRQAVTTAEADSAVPF